jgi:hypothetical protein
MLLLAGCTLPAAHSPSGYPYGYAPPHQAVQARGALQAIPWQAPDLRPIAGSPRTDKQDGKLPEDRVPPPVQRAAGRANTASTPPVAPGDSPVSEKPATDKPPAKPVREPAYDPAAYRHLEQDLAACCQELTRTVTIEPGDTLGKIAKRHGASWRLIARLSGIDEPHRIRPGQSVKVLTGTPSAEIDLAAFKLSLYVDGRLVKEYPIGVGAEKSATPTGVFTVARKVIDPPWNYRGQRAAPGAPDNPVGTRWIGFGNSYGIHGTNEPESIGMKGSLGCIRLLNEHVEEIYDALKTGSKVVVR